MIHTIHDVQSMKSLHTGIAKICIQVQLRARPVLFRSLAGREYLPANLLLLLIAGPYLKRKKGAGASKTARQPIIVMTQCTPRLPYQGRDTRLIVPDAQ